MNRKQIVLTTALALAAGFAGRALPIDLLRPAPAAAQTRAEEREDGKEDGKAAESSADGRRWEYCAVTKAQYGPTGRAGVYWIAYFRDRGVQVVDVEAGVGGNAFARAVTRLGEEGWEMSGEGELEVRLGAPSPKAVFFKRLKP